MKKRRIQKKSKNQMLTKMMLLEGQQQLEVKEMKVKVWWLVQPRETLL
jgi:hypothetical protein